jgi:fermentation-respiration switch protein FrsA (DUF1100 family)
MPAPAEQLPPRRRLIAVARIALLRDVPFWTGSRRRQWARVLAFGLYTYLGVLLVLLALENRLLFPGAYSSAGEPTFQPTGMTFEDVHLTASDGTAIHARWSAPSDWTPARGAILFSHGNGEHLGWWWPTVKLWQSELSRGVLIYDYPGYGQSAGKPTEKGCYAAAEAAHAWLTDVQKVGAGDVLLVGESLGAAMAVDLATRHDCRAVVLLAAFTSFPDMAQKTFPFLPARWLVSNRLDNLAKVPSVRGPIFIAHGTADRLVPFRHGERLFAAAREPKRFYPAPGLGHGHPEDREFWEAVRAFLRETVGK